MVGMASVPDLINKICAGIYGRLEFDYACLRGNGFSELYIHGVILEILSSVLDGSVYAIIPGFADPVLAEASVKLGRKRELDFVVFNKSDPKKSPVLVIEVKWADSSHASMDGILADVARLALMSRRYPDAACVFVLAGTRGVVERKMTARRMQRRKKMRMILAYPYRRGKMTGAQMFLRDGVGGDCTLAAKESRNLQRAVPNYPTKYASMIFSQRHESPSRWEVLAWRIEGIQ